MSGIVGILNLDGSPVDRRILGRMTDFMAYRGPDAQTIWAEGPVGFGHTMLRTTFEAEHERQPFTLDGKTWITADARIDGREQLVAKLKAKESKPADGATDVELILRAYQVWSEDCIHHLLGDFAFAIWDASRKRLFCARDHFGVKLFYYARAGNSFLFSNTLNCLRLHPLISDSLNEQAIGDFLLFGHNQDKATTTFADVQRIPPAHTLTAMPEGIDLRKYWTLPIKELIRYKDRREYVDQFKVLLNEAVQDRLRTRSVGVYFSGGLDSTTLTATAKQILSADSRPFDLRAYTVVYDWLIPDNERHYSGLAAEALGVPIQYLAADDYPIFGHWNQLDLLRPEPWEEPYLEINHDLSRLMAPHSRVVLYGEDGDAMLHPSSLADMLRVIPFWQVVSDAIEYGFTYKRRPPLGLGIKARWNRWKGKDGWTFLYPSWLNSDFEARNGLRERWNELSHPKRQKSNAVRPRVYERLSLPLWQSVLEGIDPGVSGFPFEVRLPFLDLRLLDFALALPPLPWCMDKKLLRIAMLGTLPEPVRTRPKTPMQESPYLLHLQKGDGHWVNDLEQVPELECYIDPKSMPRFAAHITSSDLAWSNFRPMTLNQWLKHRDHFCAVRPKENQHDAKQENLFTADLPHPQVPLLWEHS